jgi:snurportin-1
MEEMSCLSERSNDNAFVFTSLPYHQCSVSTMTNIMASENLFGQDGPALDGLLFYHSEAHYVPGSTPLVGWLKPHMMATVLSVPVASVYLQAEKKKYRKFHKHQSKSQVNFETESIIARGQNIRFPVVTEKFWLVTNLQLGFFEFWKSQLTL